MSSFTRKSFSTKQRRYITAGNNCAYCGEKNLGEDGIQPSLHVDHIKAVANGGDNEVNNLQPLCARCNQWKSDRPESYLINRLIREVKLLRNELAIERANRKFEDSLQKVYESA